jgi:hypothetical protein
MTEQKQASSSSNGDARTPDKRIGEVAYADTSKDAKIKPPSKEAQKSSLEGPAAYAPRENEDVRARPSTDPAKKKTGEF